MALYRPKELIEWLEREGLRPSKRRSQHFLVDQNVVDKMIALAGLDRQALVIEIGPGPGVLTEALVTRGFDLLAIEQDPAFASRLTRLGKLQVLEADALEVDWAGLLGTYPGRPVSLVANLPYQISTPLLGQLLRLGPRVDKLVLMVQREFLDRLMNQTRPGPLSVLASYYGSFQGRFNVSPHCFFPKPRVESSVIRIDLRAPCPSHAKKLEALVKAAFAHPRKRLRSALLQLDPTIELERLASYGALRAGQLSAEQWIELADSLPDSPA